MEPLDKHRTPEEEVIVSQRTGIYSFDKSGLNVGLGRYFAMALEQLNYLEYGDPAEFLSRVRGFRVPNSSLDSIWVPPRFRKQDETGDEIPLDTLLSDPSPCQLVLAEPGCGKSTLARFLTCFFIKRFCSQEQGYFGLLVPLSILRLSGMTYQEAVAHCAAKYLHLESDSQVTNDLKQNLARACIIFDGLDELPVVRRTTVAQDDVPLRREAAELIRSLRYVHMPDATAETPQKSIVTCRSKDYFEDRDSSLGTTPHYITKFSPIQMHTAIRQWHDSAKDSIQKHQPNDNASLAFLDARRRGIESALREHFELASICLTPLMLSALQTVYSDPTDLPSSVSQLCWRAINWFFVEKHRGTAYGTFVGDYDVWILQAIIDIGMYLQERVVSSKPKSLDSADLRRLVSTACPTNLTLPADYGMRKVLLLALPPFCDAGMAFW